jgi:serine/threonine protein kinase
MITGFPPYSEFKNPVSILYHISHAINPPIIHSEYNISKELEDFLQCCLKINPNERLNVNELLRHPFITGDIIVKIDNDNDNISKLSKFKIKRYNAVNPKNNNNNNNNINNNYINQINQIQISVINNDYDYDYDNDNSNNNFLKNSNLNENENEDFSYMEFINKQKESEINER